MIHELLVEVNELNCGRTQKDEPQAVEQGKAKRRGESRGRRTGPVGGKTEKEKYKAEKLKKE